MVKITSSKFTRFCLLIVLCLFLLGQINQVSAVRVCDPFTTDPDPGMLPIGTQVQFKYFTAAGPQVLTGRVEAYYIQSCFPGGGSIIGLNPQAYVIEYGAADKSRTVQNFEQLTVVLITSGKHHDEAI